MRFLLPVLALVFGTVLLLMPTVVLGQEVDDLSSPYPYSAPAWSPYVAGGLIGLLTILTLLISKRPVGASSAYASLAGMIGRIAAPEHIGSLPYYQKHKPAINWEFLFVVAAVFGSFLAAWSGGELTGRFLPSLWVDRFGSDSFALRTVVALIGGAVMAYGARMANGCTSGHGISGTLQLAVGSWIAVICFFIGGIAIAMPLYRL